MYRPILIIGLIFLCLSCAVMGPTFRDADLAKLRAGMLEENVISTLKAEPTSRSDYPDGKYLLQWIYSYGTFIGVGGSRHIAILFSPERRMIKIVHQTKIGPSLP